MIGIFQGRGIAETARAHAQIDVDFRNHLHLFNDGGSFTSLALFLTIALHANEQGWAWPGRQLLMQETGIATEQALAAALDHLRTVRIDGTRIFAHYRVKERDGRWGRSAYLIFPDLPHSQGPFEGLVEYSPRGAIPSQAGFVYLTYSTRGYRLGRDAEVVQRFRKLRYSDDGFEVVAFYAAQDADAEVERWASTWRGQHVSGAIYDLDQHQVATFIDVALAKGGSTEDPRGQRLDIADFLDEADAIDVADYGDAPDEADVADYGDAASASDAEDTFEDLFPAAAVVPERPRIPDGVSPADYVRGRVEKAHAAWAAKAADGDPWETNRHVVNWAKHHPNGELYEARTLGKRLEHELGMVPDWQEYSEVNGWLSGLVKALRIASGDADLVVSVAKRMREDGLRIPHPYSLVKTVQDEAARRRVANPTATPKVHWI